MKAPHYGLRVQEESFYSFSQWVVNLENWGVYAGPFLWCSGTTPSFSLESCSWRNPRNHVILALNLESHVWSMYSGVFVSLRPSEDHAFLASFLLHLDSWKGLACHL